MDIFFGLVLADNGSNLISVLNDELPDSATRGYILNGYILSLPTFLQKFIIFIAKFFTKMTMPGKLIIKFGQDS